MTPNKGTIMAIRNWGDQYGYPYKVISDTGPAFREDYIKQLLTFNIKHKPSSAYHPQNRSLVERGVQSVKNDLRKSSIRLTRQHLDEITFAINDTASSEGTRSANERFFGRSIRSKLPNSINPEIKSSELISRRIQKHDDRIKNKNKTNKILYEIGQRVRLQNVATRDWELKGTIDQMRTTDDGRVVSYDVLTDKGHMPTRHRRYLCPLHRDHDQKIPKNKTNTDNDNNVNDVRLKADLPQMEQTAH